MIQPFQRPNFTPTEHPSSSHGNEIRSLPDLVRFNAKHNPNHLFALQEVRDAGQHVGLAEITFKELERMIQECIHWLAEQHVSLNSPRSAEKTTARPVALYLESDVTLFVYLCALLETHVPVLLISARLNSAAVEHLLSETGAQAIICSRKTKSTVNDVAAFSARHEELHVVNAISYQEFQMRSSINGSNQTNGFSDSNFPRDEPGALILHSSGTTGLPKPIRLTNMYILGYAACHRLTPEESDGRVNVSTLPLYHGFGLLAPCLSLSTGKTCCLPSPNSIPSADTTISLIKTSGARSLMTVPTVLEQIVGTSNQQYTNELSRLDFVAIGGGALKPSVGEILAQQGVPLLNHYGATEIGAIAYICVPDETFDWHYLRLRTDLGLSLREVEENGIKTGFFKLSGNPFGWDRPFEIQDKLEKRFADSDVLEVKICGRTDDVIVLSTGEKVSPQGLENSLMTSVDGVRTAVAFGEHRNEIGVIVELQDLYYEKDVAKVKENIWTELQRINKNLDGHSRIPAREAIIVKSKDGVLPRSDKGSIMRNEVYRLYQDEISRVYEALDSSGLAVPAAPANSSTEELHGYIKSLVQTSLQDRMGSVSLESDDDFFEIGMDSLEATRVARALANIPNAKDFPGLSKDVSPLVVYRNPTVAKLLTALQGTDVAHHNSVSRSVRMTDMLKKFQRKIQRTTVLLTGSTGNLGAHMLARLAKDDKIQKVICLNRAKSLSSSPGDLMERQLAANTKYGVTITESHWSKVELRVANTQLPTLGLGETDLESLQGEVSHVIHNAWPMDFQRSLESYGSQLLTVENLINFCKDSKAKQSVSKPKFTFLSSIAVAGRHPSRLISESAIEDPNSTTPMGYAEAKWVCEHMIAAASKSLEGSVDFDIIRVGQVTGSNRTGYWNPSEHVPQLVSVSQEVGAFPELTGHYSWLPVDTASQAILDISLATGSQLYYHVENPIRQPWKELLHYLTHVMKLERIPFEDWVHRTKTSKSESVKHLLEFLERDFLKLSGGGVVLDTKQSRAVSAALRGSNGISLEQIDRYLGFWKAAGKISA